MISATWSWKDKAGHHHGSHTPTSPEAVLLGKTAYHTKQIRRECKSIEVHVSYNSYIIAFYGQVGYVVPNSWVKN